MGTMTDDESAVPPRREPSPPGPGTPGGPDGPDGPGSTGPGGPASGTAGATRADARAQEPAADGPARTRLRRGRGDDAVLAGVCHAGGRYFDVDPVIFRIVLAVLSLTGGIGLIVYGLGWLVVPQEGEEDSEAQRLLSGRIEGAPLTAVLMALVGCGLYASMINNSASQAFSLLLVAATAGAVYWSRQRGRTQGAGEAASVVAGPAADAPPEPQAPPEPGTASWWREPLTKEPGYLWGPTDGPRPRGGAFAWPRPSGGAFVRPRPRGGAFVRPARRERQWVFGLALFWLAAAACAAGTLATWWSRPAPVSAEIGLASAVAVLGCGYLVAAFAGRPSGGTRFWTVVAVAALVAAATLPKTGQGVRTSAWRPATAAAVHSSYARGAGTGRLDLRSVRLSGATVHTRLAVGAGRAQVLLPRDARVRLTYRVGAAQVDLPGAEDHFTVRDSTVAYDPPRGVRPDGTLLVDVTVRAGLLEVVR
jgi:phage shock protein PspC (stress-responsive transcriptional regulator)